MTAEPDLLPMPWIERYAVVGDIAYPVSSDPDGDYVAHDDHTAAMQAYARANVAHATAARDAEVDALRTKLRNVAGAEQELVSARRRIDEQEENIEALRAEVERLEGALSVTQESHKWVNAQRHRAEAQAAELREAGARVTAAFRAHGDATPWTRESERTRHECEAAMIALDAALSRAANDTQAGGGGA